MARFSHTLSLLRCQASRDIKRDPLATQGHDCKREAQWGTQRPNAKSRDRRTNIKSPFPNRMSYSKKPRRIFLNEREREALGNVVRKGRGGQFSEDRVFLSFSSLQCGRPPFPLPACCSSKKRSGGLHQPRTGSSQPALPGKKAPGYLPRHSKNLS